MRLSKLRFCMDARKQVIELLAKRHCPLIRSGLHNVYELPDGTRWVTPINNGSGNAWGCAWRNNLSDLKVALGLSKRGSPARQGERKQKKKTNHVHSPLPILESEPAPAKLGFGDKMRLAVRGTRTPRGFEKKSVTLPRLDSGGVQAECSEPTSRLETVESPAPQPPRKSHEYKPSQHGQVRRWSPEDIQAANAAMRAGTLTKFLKEHHQACQPVIQQQTKESDTMLTVEMIDSSMKELDDAMGIATQQIKDEEVILARLQTEIAQANERRQAAHDKHNSLADAKTNLAVIRDDIGKVRPLLGHLAQKPVAIPVRGRVHAMKLKDALKIVLQHAEKPLGVSEMYEAISKLGVNYSKQSLYSFLNVSKKQNGEAIVVKIGDNRYARPGFAATA